MVPIVGQLRSNDLELVGQWIATGRLVPVIDRRYPLHETAVAVQYLETGHAKGKVVITVLAD